MDASQLADQSGLSDLSAASIVIDEPYLGPPPPDQTTGPATSPSRPSQINTTPYGKATPGPSRPRTDAADTSNTVWTPSPDASSSRSKSSNRSIQRPSSRNSQVKGNESIGSSVGTFDYSNASFSESFLRQAGAHMLAGLDETELPQSRSASSSPRYRTSSSPTVTAKPIRVVDPRTPFTGKSLRTRMAEAGMLDSPASSDGSSPSSSPTTRMLPDSCTRTISVGEDAAEEQSPEPNFDSPQAEAFSKPHSPSLDRLRHGSFASPLRQGSSISMNSLGMEEQHEWSEGLSMVPEESYVEDASQLPAFQAAYDQSSPILQARSSPAALPIDSPSPGPDTGTSSPSPAISGYDHVSREEQDAGERAAWMEESSNSTDMPPQISSAGIEPEQSSDKSDSSAHARSAPSSPRKTSPPTPSRMVNTPKSFARLRVGTPVRSSPLSREVNFSPSSAGSNASRWQSPVNQRDGEDLAVASPLPTSENRLEHASPSTPTKDEVVSDTTSAPHPPSDPHTPNAAASIHRERGTPSQLWSPATSASFATPASQRPQHPAAPTTPALLPHTPLHAFSSPVGDFGTPQWSPSPAASPAKAHVAQFDAERPQAEPATEAQQEEEEEEELASSSASVGSERKQSGDVSTASQSAVEASPHVKDSPVEMKPSLSPASPAQHFDSPSAAKFSRLQLSRISPPTSIPTSLTAVPELRTLASAFDSLHHLSDTRVSRLLAQLSASTARIDELESALEVRDAERAELQKVREMLTELSGQYEELVREADGRDAAMVEMVSKLRGELKAGGRGREVELERQLEEERRLREVERRDYEVRLQGLLSAAPVTSLEAIAEATLGDEEKMTTVVEQAKEQLRVTLEKDFEVRRAMEQRQLQARVEELERQLAAASPTSAQNADEAGVEELQRQVDHLTSELDRRFEELTDLREEVGTITAEKDHAEQRIVALEEELDQAQHYSSENEHAANEVDELRTRLVESDTHIAHVEETLSHTTARLTSLTVERDALSHANTLLTQSHRESADRVAQLESHILTLESRLPTRTPSKSHPTTTADTPATPANDRVAKLQKELSTLQLELLRLGKANDALQEDNVHFSIALSAKQLELGMVKRNARFALKNARALVQEEARVGLPLSKSVVKEKKEEEGVKFPVVPKGGIGEKEEEGKENERPEAGVNQARLHARQMLAQRRAAEGAGGGEGVGGARRQRQMLAA